MRGMDVITAIRKARRKPACVFVYLVDRVDSGQPEVSFTGNVALEIAAGDSLTDIDFRPLHGLYVILCNVVGDERRYRRLREFVEAVKPSRLVVPEEALA